MGGVLGAGLARGGLAASGLRVVVAGRFRPPAWQGSAFVEADLLEPGSLTSLVREFQPKVVLHAAALARIDRCEQEPELANRLHVGAVQEGMEALHATGGRWITISTDQVFDGKADFYAEGAAPSPIHAYGRSKAAGEEATLAREGLVVRLPLLLGPAVPGRPERMGADRVLVEAARRGEVWQLFEDEWRAPADAADFVEPLRALLEVERSPDAAGVYHLAGAQAIDRYQLGELACAAADVPFVHQRARLADWSGAPRPPRLILTCQRTERELGSPAPDLRQPLARSAAAARAQAQGQEN